MARIAGDDFVTLDRGLWGIAIGIRFMDYDKIVGMILPCDLHGLGASDAAICEFMADSGAQRPEVGHE